MVPTSFLSRVRDTPAHYRPVMADAADIDKALIRQEQIWAGLYGPPKAAELVAEARRRFAAEPTVEVATVLATVEPDDDIDPDEAGTYRPAVG